MGYETSMTGRITITPALTWQDIKNSKHFGDGLNGWPKHPDLVFEIETEGREMPEGILTSSAPLRSSRPATTTRRAARTPRAS
jgi:hypothetical protein